MGTTPERRLPERTCIGCRRRAGVDELIRCRLSADGAMRSGEAAGQLTGRGAWICAGSVACFDVAVKRGAFGRAWRRPVDREVLDEFRLAFGPPPSDMRQSRVPGRPGGSAPTKG